ncbi:hypothetical protein Tco_0219042 [Tanacetum coccineum]
MLQMSKSLWKQSKSRFREVLGCSISPRRYQPEVPKKSSSHGIIILYHENKPATLMRLILHAYNNLRVYEVSEKVFKFHSTSQNCIFFILRLLACTNEVSTTSGDFGVSNAGGTSQVLSTPCAMMCLLVFAITQQTSPHVENKIFSRLKEIEFGGIGLRWQVAMLTVKVKKFIQRTGRNMDFKEK